MASPRTPSKPRLSMDGFKKTSPGELFWDLITFDRLHTGPIVHLIYWAGLGILVLGCFATMGGAVGVAWREENVGLRVALAIPVIITGFLFLAAAALLWRAFCEFYVAVLRISDDLRFLRRSAEQGQSSPLTPDPAPAFLEPESRPEPTQPRSGKRPSDKALRS